MSIDIYNEYNGKRGNFIAKNSHVLGVAEFDAKRKHFVLRDFTDGEMSHLDDEFWCFPTKMKVVMYGTIKRTDWDEDSGYLGPENEVTFAPIGYGDNYDIEDIVNRFTWIDYPHELMDKVSIKNAMDAIKDKIRESNKDTGNEDENEDVEDDDKDDEDTGATFNPLYDNVNIYINIQKKKKFVECVENIYKEMNYWCEKTGVPIDDALEFFAKMTAEYRRV